MAWGRLGFFVVSRGGRTPRVLARNEAKGGGHAGSPGSVEPLNAFWPSTGELFTNCALPEVSSTLSQSSQFPNMFVGKRLPQRAFMRWETLQLAFTGLAHSYVIPGLRTLMVSNLSIRETTHLVTAGAFSAWTQNCCKKA